MKKRAWGKTAGQLGLFLMILGLLIFGPQRKLPVGCVGAEKAEAASWKLKNGKVSNGKTVYRTDSKSFYSCNTKGKKKKIIYKGNYLLFNPKIKYLYKGKIFIEFFYMYDGMYGRHEGKMVVYDIAKKRLTKISKPFHILGKSGGYLLGCGLISHTGYPGDQDSIRDIADPIYVYNMSNGKMKKLTEYGLEGKVSGKYFYYASYSNQKLSIVRCKPNGGSKKVLKKISWKWNLYDIEKMTAHSLTYYNVNSGKTYTVRF